jgi:PAS domain S-box-containing protein
VPPRTPPTRSRRLPDREDAWQRRYEQLVEASFQPVIAHDGGLISEVNRAFTTVFGYSQEEAVGMRLDELLAAGEPGQLDDRLRSTGACLELVGCTKYGEQRFFEVAGRHAAAGGEPAGLCVLNDVTERKLAEEQVGVLAFQYATDLTMVSQAARQLPRTADAVASRRAICESACQVCDGVVAALLEPDSLGRMIVTAVSGLAGDDLPMTVAEASVAAEVFESGEPLFVADLAREPGVGALAIREAGAVSALWQPVARDVGAMGVLLVAWDRAVLDVFDRSAAVAGLFATEAAAAIERADFLTQLDELNRALEVQIEALHVSDQVKSDFVSSVSHELRTPLSSILGYLDVLTEGAAGELSVEQLEFLDIIDHNARRLLTLINDLLTLSWLDSGRTIVRTQPTDVCDLVRAHVQEVQPVVDARGQALHVDLPAGAVVAAVDSERFGQVLSNLLVNASKFTHQGGALTVSVSVEDEEAVLSVADNGIGIAPDDVDRLFERFFRATSATDQAIPGTGLGLAICKGIIEAHRGRVSVSSRLGQGSRFTVFLPLSLSSDPR